MADLPAAGVERVGEPDRSTAADELGSAYPNPLPGARHQSGNAALARREAGDAQQAARRQYTMRLVQRGAGCLRVGEVALEGGADQVVDFTNREAVNAGGAPSQCTVSTSVEALEMVA